MKITDRTLDRRLSGLTPPGDDAPVVDRIRYLITFMRKTQAQFGQLIGIDPSNMSKMMSGRIRVTDRVINRIVIELGVSKQWLLHGDDVPFARNAHDGTLPVIDAPADTAGANRGAPVYDIDVTAGCQELSMMFTDDRIVGRVNMPGMGSLSPVVRVTGDSMSPRIPHGAYIQIRRIAPDAPILWGNIFVVVTEDYRMVKVVRRNADPAMVTLHSFNPDYDDLDLPRKDIRALYLVDAVLNYDVLS